MREIDQILEFTIHLGKNMLETGANIERVNLAMSRVLHAYEISEVSLHTMSTHISISGCDKNGHLGIRQISVDGNSIFLEKLKRLNSLSYQIAEEKPALDTLFPKMEEAMNVKDYPWFVILAGFLVALAGLARIFSASWQELLVIELNTLLLFGLNIIWSRYRINHIITNFIGMFLASAIGLFFTYIGFAQNFYTIAITTAFFLIPGIPMVNSVRNILSGNELNGIVELLKVLLEVVTIVAGLAAALFSFGFWMDATLEESIVITNPTFLYYLELVFMTLMCSVGFGISFRISLKDLVFAGIGGVIIRIVYILMMIAAPDYRIIYVTIPAFSAALYAEIVAHIRKQPSTLYLYPSIVPLIPGDLIYYTGLAIIWNNVALLNNGVECLLHLVGMSVGFVICSSVVLGVRRIKLKRLLQALTLKRRKERREIENSDEQ